MDPAAEDQRVNLQVETLRRLAKENDVDFWADEERCHRIVQFQDRAAQTRVFIERCRKTLSMVYKTMFPRIYWPDREVQRHSSCSKPRQNANDCRGEICSHLGKNSPFED